MTIKKVVLGASLLVAGNAVAQDKTYTVREGDTLSEIASKFGVKTKAVLTANNLASADKLKLGQTLRIPAQEAKPVVAANPTSPSSHLYTVRQGDNDVIISKRLGVRAKELRLANMGVKWTNLRPGQTLNVPGEKSWYATLAHRSTPAQSQAVAVAKKAPEKAPAKKTVVAARTYKVQEGDNDWIIAKRVGTKPSVLRNLNPDVKWTSLQIGKTIRIPGAGTSTVVAAKTDSNAKRIRSRYAKIVGDAVTLRRGPGTNHDIVTRVDKGTRVTVLDRDGSWYKLRFPRGTEAWVRGDFLIAAAAPQVVASQDKKTKSKKSGSKRTVVASNTPLRSSSRFSRTRGGSKPKYTRSGGQAVNVDTQGNALLEKAKGYLGVRYRYGAASRSATDCSGFTTQVYRSQGIKLPRTAREQSGRGQSVGKGSLKAGDLVFFKTNRGTRINHVGIYVGNGKFMHASSGKGRVMVSSLNEGYYQRRYAGAKRVANFKTASKKEAPKPVVKNTAPAPKNDPVTVPTDPNPTIQSGDGGK